MDKERFLEVESLFWKMIHSSDQQLEAIVNVDEGSEQQKLHKLAAALIIKDRELEGSHFLNLSRAVKNESQHGERSTVTAQR